MAIWNEQAPAIPALSELRKEPGEFTKVLFEHLTDYGQACFWKDIRVATRSEDSGTLGRMLDAWYWTMIVRLDKGYHEHMKGSSPQDTYSLEGLRRDLGL